MKEEYNEKEREAYEKGLEDGLAIAKRNYKPKCITVINENEEIMSFTLTPYDKN